MLHPHPIKIERDLEAYLQLGISSVVIDNLNEFWEVAAYRHYITVMLRLALVAPDALIDLSRKFGARQLEIIIDWLFSHVGSQAKSADTHHVAILGCLEIASDADSQDIGAIDRIDIGARFSAN